MAVRAFAFAALLAVGAIAEERNNLPITESVTLGSGDKAVTFGGVDGPPIHFNQCFPYDPKEYGAIKVCGANTKVKVFLMGRCAGYYAYEEDVGQCTGATTEECMEVDLQTSHWLPAAQSYAIVPCGAGQGEVHDYEGPACKGMDECIKYAHEQAQKELDDKMEAEYKKDWKGKGHVMKTGRKAKSMGQGYRPSTLG